MNIWTGLLLNQGHITDKQVVAEIAAEPMPVEAEAARVQAQRNEREARRNLGLTAAIARLGFR